MGDCKRQ